MENSVNKQSKIEKDIIDIQKEKAKIYELLRQGDLQKLNTYLQGELTEKHLVEKALYNMVSNQAPRTVEENANNALHFLDTLEKEKTLELSKEKLKSKR